VSSMDSPKKQERSKLDAFWQDAYFHFECIRCESPSGRLVSKILFWFLTICHCASPKVEGHPQLFGSMKSGPLLFPRLHIKRCSSAHSCGRGVDVSSPLVVCVELQQGEETDDPGRGP
jgi:hypothetical protein